MTRFLRLLLAIMLVALFLIAPHKASASVQDFTINDFSADYSINNADRQGEMHVVERINLTFTDFNHGILRAIPNSYKGLPLKLHVQNISSTSGAPTQFTTYGQNGNTVLKIGDPNRTLTGKQSYTIDYTVQNVITFYNDHDELYWDINGDQWPQPFEHVTARFHLAHGLSVNQSVCYTGTLVVRSKTAPFLESVMVLNLLLPSHSKATRP